MEFPRLVYKRKHGKEFDYVLVEDQDQYDAKIGEGWFGTVPEALDAGSDPAAPANPGDTGAGAGGSTGVGNVPSGAAPTRAEMEEMAKRLGIKGNISGMKDKTLMDKIDAALKAGKE